MNASCIWTYLWTVLLSCHDFRRHPVRGTNHCYSLVLFRGDLGAEAEVRCKINRRWSVTSIPVLSTLRYAHAIACHTLSWFVTAKSHAIARTLRAWDNQLHVHSTAGAYAWSEYCRHCNICTRTHGLTSRSMKLRATWLTCCLMHVLSTSLSGFCSTLLRCMQFPCTFLYFYAS